MDQPLFSVITANFNSGDRLALTAASIAGQGVPLEHLILDGGSTDGSHDLAHSLAAADPRFRVWSEPDRGVYDAMNKGLRRARGRYLYFIGAGDILHDGILARVREGLPSHDRGFVYGDVLFSDGRRYDGPTWLEKLYDRNVSHQAVFYGREVFDLVGDYDLKYRHWSDWATNIRCFGDDRVDKVYLPIVVATFELGGISTPGDPAFRRDKNAIYRRHAGLANFARLKAAEATARGCRLIARTVTRRRSAATPP